MPFDPCTICDDPCFLAQAALGRDSYHQAVLSLLCRMTNALEEASGQVQSFTMNLAQVAGTYPLFTATGSVIIDRIDFYNDVAATGLTSVSSATNDGTPTTLLASVTQATLTGGKNLTPYTTPFVLGSGKQGRYTIVGNGTAGTIIAIVKYRGDGVLA